MGHGIDLDASTHERHRVAVLDRLKLRAPAQPEAIPEMRHKVVAYADRLGAAESACEAVRLAVSEAVTNVVVHAYEGQETGDVSVEAWPDGDHHLMVVITDDGRGFLPRPPSVGMGMGMGMGLMAQVADAFIVTSRDGMPGVTVSLSFALSDRETEAEPRTFR